jgi:quinol monooxygenase YgiN
VAFVFEASGLTQDEYDRIMAELAEKSGGDWTPAGALAHLAGPIDGGRWRVIDVWESEDAANAFYGSDAFAPVREGTAGAELSTTPWALHRTEVFQTFSQTA